MNSQKKADLALVVITFFWGIANLISDYMMGFWAPMQLNAIRFIVAFVVSYAILRRRMKGVSRTTLLSGALVGFLPLSRSARQGCVRREKARLRKLLRQTSLQALFGLKPV